MATSIFFRGKIYLATRGPSDSLRFCVGTVVQLCRGFARGYWLVFLGRKVTIRARRQVQIGRFTRVEDYCELDGFGTHGLTIGVGCKIGKFSILRVPPVPYRRGQFIRVGDGTTFAEFCFVGGAGQVTIGKRNALGQYVSLHPQNHQPVGERAKSGATERGISIGDDNWLGAKVTVLDGASIGDRSIVAAGAVVRGEFRSDVLLAGVPAVTKRSLSK